MDIGPSPSLHIPLLTLEEPAIQQKQLPVVVFMPNHPSQALIDGPDGGVEVIGSPADLLEFRDRLGPLVFFIVDLLLHQLRSMRILVGYADEDDCPALLVGKVNALAGFAATHAKQHAFPSILSMVLILVNLLKTASLFEIYPLLDLLSESAQGGIKVVSGIFDILVIGEYHQDPSWYLSEQCDYHLQHLLIPLEDVVPPGVHVVIGEVEYLLVLIMRDNVEQYLAIFDYMLVHELFPPYVQFVLPLFDRLHGSRSEEDGIRLATLDLLEGKPRHQTVQRQAVVGNVPKAVTLKHSAPQLDFEYQTVVLQLVVVDTQQFTAVLVCLKELDYSVQKLGGLVDVEKGVPLNPLERLAYLILLLYDEKQLSDCPIIVLQSMRPRLAIKLQLRIAQAQYQLHQSLLHIRT